MCLCDGPGLSDKSGSPNKSGQVNFATCTTLVQDPFSGRNAVCRENHFGRQSPSTWTEFGRHSEPSDLTPIIHEIHKLHSQECHLEMPRIQKIDRLRSQDTHQELLNAIRNIEVEPPDSGSTHEPFHRFTRKVRQGVSTWPSGLQQKSPPSNGAAGRCLSSLSNGR